MSLITFSDGDPDAVQDDAAQEKINAAAKASAATIEDNVKWLISLDEEKKAHALTLDRIASVRDEVEKALIDQFSLAGIQSVNALGKIVHLHRMPYCSVPAETMGEVIEILDEAGVGNLAPRSVSASTIKALLKEDEATWKEKLGSMISTGERYSVRIRTSK